MSNDRNDEDPAVNQEPPGPDDTPSLFPAPDLEALEREVERLREREVAEAARQRQQDEQEAEEQAEREAHYRAESAEHHAESVRAGDQRLAEARTRAAAANPDTPAPEERRKAPAKQKRKRKGKQNAPKPAEALTFETATTPDELVLAAVADCGCARPAPAWRELIRWWRRRAIRNPIDAELVKALRAVLGKYALPWIASDGGAEDFRAVVPGADKPLDIMECHRRWLDLPEPRPRHLVSVMVGLWDRLAPRRVARDPRSSAIIPHGLRDADRNQGVLPLGLDRTTPLGPVQESEQGYLPGLEPATSLVPPVPWLTLYDLTGVGPGANTRPWCALGAAAVRGGLDRRVDRRP